MYNVHAKAISALSEADPKYTLATMTFVNSTVRTPISRAMSDMTETKKKGAKAVCLNNTAKNNAYRYIRKNYKYLHHVIHCDYMTTAEKMVALMDIPNIGLAKAGFILQMCIGKVGCIDCHNQNMFGIDKKDLTVPKRAKLAEKLRKSHDYINMCEKLGGTEYLWNNWCKFIAGKYPNKFDNAHAVSRVHVDAIVTIA